VDQCQGAELGKVNRTVLRNILPATVDVGFDHYTSDGAVASDQLLADGVDDLRLVEMILEGVSV
jgi:hypothetical protein